jgi:hypothetical protein
VFATGRFTEDPNWKKHDPVGRIGVTDRKLRRADVSHLQVKFLSHLPFHSRFDRFAGLTLSAGELPQSSVSLFMRTLAN